MLNLFVWSYWWPLIVVSAIFFGRVWCIICPVELITALFSKIGLKLKRPNWVLSGWSITIFYIIILTVGLNIIAVHRNPTYMAIYLSSLIIISIITGFLWEKNTFCRYFCPVGYVLGLYSKLSYLGLRVKNKNVCKSCKDKSCIHKNYSYNLNYKSCGVDLNPTNIEDNSHCILCAGCMKTCSKYKSKDIEGRPNPEIRKVGFAKSLFSLKPLKTAEWFFLFILSGFVIYEIVSEFSEAKKILLFVPNYLSQSIGSDSNIIKGLIKSAFIFFILPSIIWFVPYFLTKIKIRDYIKYYSQMFIPLIASAHLCKAILKTTSRVPYFKYVFSDIMGAETAQNISDGVITLTQLENFA